MLAEGSPKRDDVSELCQSGGPWANFWGRAWWRHQMEPFSTLLALCAVNSPVTGEFPSQRPVTRSFDVFFDLQLNKRLSKQSWGWWFEKPSRSLWRNCNGQNDRPLRTTCYTEWKLFLIEKLVVKVQLMIHSSSGNVLEPIRQQVSLLEYMMIHWDLWRHMSSVQGPFWAWAQPMRADVKCNVASHWLGPYPE